jgi:hypothetical protein
MAETIYLEPILRNFFSDKMSEMNFCLPARIDNVQNLKQGRVDVKPLYIPRYLDNTYSEIPAIKNVPIVFACANESGQVFAPKQGDTVLLIFSQCNIDNFKAGSVEPYSTVFDRSFDINDAIALVGFSPFNVNPINTEKHKKDYELGDVSTFNNLGKENENKINVKKDGTIKIISSSTTVESEAMVKMDSPNIKTKGTLSSGTGVSGSFQTALGQNVIVSNGIIVSIE